MLRVLLTISAALLTIVASLRSDGAEGNFDLGVIVRFSLACSNCHEGECSGRTSFGSEPHTATGHIQRYSGSVDPEMEIRLYALLHRMKLDCTYPPMRVPQGGRGRWEREVLLPYRDASLNGYFIPLGQLDAGRYRLSLQFDREPTVQIAVISSAFEPIWTGCRTKGEPRMTTDVELESAGAPYLRIRSDDAYPLFLERVSIEPR